MVICMKYATAFLFLVPVALMAQNAESSSAHIHGDGQLGLVLSENEIAMALEVPGQDIVGFEHPAENEEDRARVADAISDLSKPLAIFELPPEAGCVTASANVALVGDPFGQEETTESHAAQHSEFQADYLLQCEDIGAMTSIRFTYFERFTDARQLTVRLSSASGTQEVLVQRETPFLTLP